MPSYPAGMTVSNHALITLADAPRRTRLSHSQREVNAAHAAQRGPGERPNAVLRSWKIFRKIRCCPLRTTALVNAVQVLILAG